jgi:hypothetical protein
LKKKSSIEASGAENQPFSDYKNVSYQNTSSNSEYTSQAKIDPKKIYENRHMAAIQEEQPSNSHLSSSYNSSDFGSKSIGSSPQQNSPDMFSYSQSQSEFALSRVNVKTKLPQPAFMPMDEEEENYRPKPVFTNNHIASAAAREISANLH